MDLEPRESPCPVYLLCPKFVSRQLCFKKKKKRLAYNNGHIYVAAIFIRENRLASIKDDGISIMKVEINPEPASSYIGRRRRKKEKKKEEEEKKRKPTSRSVAG